MLRICALLTVLALGPLPRTALSKPVTSSAITSSTVTLTSSPQGRVIVLMYHSVRALDSKEASNLAVRRLTVEPKAFELQIKHLQSLGCAFITASQVLEARGGCHVALTFDDGYVDNASVAFPILRRLKVSATMFVVTGTLGSPRHLSWAQVSQMHGAGIEIGSHSATHADLTQLSTDLLHTEVIGSKRTLETQLGRAVGAISYPNGASNPRVLEAVRAAGYTVAFAKEGGAVTPSSGSLALPRIRISGRADIERFKRTIANALGTAK